MLLERERELAVITDAVGAACDGSHGATILVTGEPGIGKSALLAAARDAARARDMTVLHAVGSPLDRGVAFAVVRQWFAHLSAATDRDLPPFDGPGAALLDLVVGADAARSAADAPSLARAVAWVLAGMAEQAPVLLLADDVQWTDAGSQELLALLAPHVREAGVVLVGGMRTDDALVDGGSDRVLPRLLALTDATYLEPRPLGRDAVRRHASAYIRQEPHPTLVDTLLEVTGGVPFLLVEQLASLDVELLVHGKESEVVTCVREHAARGVRAAVRERLSLLGGDARRVAHAVLVLAEHAGLRTAARVADLDAATTVAAVDQLVASNILASGVEPLRVMHPLIGQAMLDELGAAATSELHARALDVLRDAGVHPPDLAAHALRAPARGEPAVVELLARAAEDALSRGVPDLAARLLDRALREPAPADREPALLTRSGLAHVRAHDFSGGVERYRAALARLDSLDARVRLLIELGDALLFAGEGPEAIAAFDEARAQLDEGGIDGRDPLRRTLIAHVAPAAAILSASWQGELWAAAQAALQEDPSADSHVDRQLYVTAALGMTLAVSSSSKEAAAIAFRGLDGVRLVHEESADSHLIYGATAVLAWTGHYDEERQVVDAVAADARRRGSVFGHASAMYTHGTIEWTQGHPRQAVADFRAATAAGHDGWVIYLGAAQAGLVSCLLELGELDEARAAWAELDEAAWRETMMAPLVSFAKGELSLAEGDVSGALDAYLESDRQRTAITTNPAVNDGWARAVPLLAEAGRRDEASALIDAVRDQAQAWGAPRVLGLLRRAEAAIADGVHTRRSLLDQAVHHLREARCGTELVRTLLLLGRVDIELGATPTAHTVLGEAAGLARQLGLRPLELEVLDALELSGRPTAPRPLRGTERLTPGEARVVELAARGMTNREIAEALFVTVKAVEWHLSNAYPKLGIKGRRELPSVIEAR